MEKHQRSIEYSENTEKSMSNLERAIRKAFATAKRPDRNWKKIYVAVDLHGVVLLPNYENTSTEYYPLAREVMQTLTNRSDVVLIMYSCSKREEVQKYIEFFLKDGIKFDYIGHNPEVVETRFGDFTHKPYFNILLEDKAGFDPEIDWDIIKNTLSEIPIL